jgi:DMSO/TMAO reductase YedYZ molybdopterin-dependent catalytic subunit
MQPVPARRRRARGRRSGAAALLGSIIGIVTALVALGVAQAIAAIINSQIGGPVDAVGELSIDHTPPPVKNFAIREFGSNDKTVLVWGIRGVLIIFAVFIGVLALRRLWLGMAGLAVFTVVGIYAAESQPTAKVTDILPSIIGGLVAAVLMRYLVGLADPGLARRAAHRTDTTGRGLQGLARESRAPGGTGQDSQDRAGQPVWQQWRPPDGQPQPAAAAPDTPDIPDTPDAQEAQDALDAVGGAAGPDGPDGSPEAPAGVAATPGGPASPHRPAWQDRGPWQPATAASPNRRKFMIVSAAAAAGGLAIYKGGTWLANTRDVTNAQKTLKLPPAATPAPPLPSGYDLKIPGLSSFITPNSAFYRVDTAIVLPEILPEAWHLRIHGMVERELTLSFDDVLKGPLLEDYITLCCVSNPVGGPYIGNAKWLGLSLRSLLRKAGIRAGADQLLCTSADGFTSGTPVQTAMDGRDAMLAVAMNDTALPVEHGFPVRLVIPGLYGYVSACKWITNIEVTTYAANTAYWAQRGWSAQAPIKTESRIDVPQLGGAPLKAGQQTAIAGVAWAQHKGIEAVEVRVGNGAWQQARLAAVPDLDTWRQWVHYWTPPHSGNYLIEARATDKTGYTQTSLVEPETPNGASGYPSMLASVVG